jgi:voltage-gated potassium channel Kch
MSYAPCILKLLRAFGANDRGSCALLEELESGMTLREVGQGQYVAADAAAAYRVRALSLKAAGADTSDLEQLVARLAALPPADQLALYHFKSSGQVFTLFVRERVEIPVGCVCLPRQLSRDGASPESR